MTQPASFNARRARAKRPCPIWNDAFQRDTQHLEADEVGAYVMILLAMWTREDCDFPDDDRRLARVSRVSTRLWKSRVGPALRPLFQSRDGSLFSKRLREEATYVQRQVTLQSDRKTGENLANTLESWGSDFSADTSTETTAEPSAALSFPTTQHIGGGGGARAREHTHTREADPPPPEDPHDAILIAAKVDPSKDVTAKWWSTSNLHTADQWRGLGLTDAEIIREIEAIMLGKADPPGSLAYFTAAMRRAAGRKSAPPLTPDTAKEHVNGSPKPDRREARADEHFDRMRARIARAAARSAP